MGVAVRIAAALASGLILRLVSPPIGLHWLHWFSFVPLLLALPGDRGRDFTLGYLSGVAGVAALFWWLTDTITTFSNIPMALAIPIVLLFSAVFGLPYGLLTACLHPLRRRFGPAWVFLFPAVWVAGELLQPALFPYYQGVGQYRVPYTWQLASVFGAMGVSYLVLLTNCAVAAVGMAVREGAPRPWGVFAAVGMLFLLNLGYGYRRFHAVEAELAAAPTLRASIVQDGATLLQRFEERGSQVMKGWIARTRQVAPMEPDLVVWPEGSIAYNPTDARVAPVLGQLAREGGFHLLLGGGTSEPDPLNVQRRLHMNSCYLFADDGEVQGRYDKMVPLPFGEYLPWPVSYLRDYIQGPGNFRAGTEPHVFNVNGTTFTTPICYEAILERQMRRLMDVDLFVNITNDGWFGDTAAPHQHAMLSAVHAVELGRPMLRVAYTGVSMVIEPHGVIRDETEPFTEVATVTTLRLGRFETPYRTWGRYFPYLCAVVAAASLWAARRSVTSAPSPA